MDNKYTFKKAGNAIHRGKGFGITGADWELYCNNKPTGIKISNCGAYAPKHILGPNNKKIGTADEMAIAKQKAISYYENTVKESVMSKFEKYLTEVKTIEQTKFKFGGYVVAGSKRGYIEEVDFKNKRLYIEDDDGAVHDVSFSAVDHYEPPKRHD